MSICRIGKWEAVLRIGKWEVDLGGGSGRLEVRIWNLEVGS